MGVSHVHRRAVEHSSEPGLQIVAGNLIRIKGFSPLCQEQMVCPEL